MSGTASIDKHGKYIYRGDVGRQLDRVFLNIRHLLLDAGASLSDIACLIIYLRDVSDYFTVSRYMETHYGETPYVIVRGKVCRSEWLVEIECMALQRQ
ncbi:Rid family hydrolase [Bacteroides pyogenes]|uniref:Rid family hydrolase n=1 Tax=Bacteroides pyogenes TaxID=310300 RepID=UPI0009E04BF6